MAQAQAGVVLFEQAGLRPGLCAALRIQLSDAADVTCAAEASLSDLAARLRTGAERLRAQRARLGVLLERDPDPGKLRMYILASQSDQAVIAIERIEDRPDPDIDRSLALKVRNAYDVIDYVDTTRPVSPAPLAAALSTPTPPSAAEPPQAAPDALWAMLLDAGAGLALGNSLRWVSSFGLGLSRVRSGQRWELALGVRLYTERSEELEAAYLSMKERGPFLAGRWLWRRGRVELGGALEAQLSVLDAQGIARDGRSASGRELTPLLNLGAELRVRLFSSVYLRFAPSLELPLLRHKLAVEDVVLIQDQVVRGTLPLSLLVVLPLRRAPESFQP